MLLCAPPSGDLLVLRIWPTYSDDLKDTKAWLSATGLDTSNLFRSSSCRTWQPYIQFWTHKSVKLTPKTQFFKPICYRRTIGRRGSSSLVPVACVFPPCLCLRGCYGVSRLLYKACVNAGFVYLAHALYTSPRVKAVTTGPMVPVVTTRPRASIVSGFLMVSQDDLASTRTVRICSS